MPLLPHLPAVLLPAILCTGIATAALSAQPPQNVDSLIACMGSKDFSASDECATALTELSRRDASVRGDGRVHRAFAARVYRDVEHFREWRRWVESMTDAERERESPEYEDEASTAWLVSTIRELVPHAGPETQPMLFDALLAAASMDGGLRRIVAHCGRPAFGAALAYVQSDALDRRTTGYDVLGLMLEAHAGGSLASPLSSRDRDAAARAITAGLQEADPDVRIVAIRAAQRGRVEGALPILRVLALTERRHGRDRIQQAAADAVASLSR